MRVITTDPVVWPVASALLDCLCSEYSGLNQLCSCAIIPGSTVVMDFCSCGDDACGQGFVRLDSVYPTIRFPTQILDGSRCDFNTWAVRLHVGVFRCIPTLHDDGTPPDAPEQTDAARVLFDDMFTILQAIRCCDYLAGMMFILGAFVPMSDGACGGGYWPVTIKVTL